MMLAGYLKDAPGRPQSGRVELKISPGIGEAKFSLGEGKNPLGRVSLGLSQRGVQDNKAKLLRFRFLRQLERTKLLCL